MTTIVAEPLQIDSQGKKEALAALLRVLRAETNEGRIETENYLGILVSLYWSSTAFVEDFDRPTAKDWLQEVERTASLLANLIENPPNPPGQLVIHRMMGSRYDATRLIAELRKFAAAATDPIDDSRDTSEGPEAHSSPAERRVVLIDAQISALQ